MAGQIDFGILETPNIFGGALRAQALGEQDRDQIMRRRALRSNDVNALREVDPEEARAMQGQQRADAERAARIAGAQGAASGDYQAARTAYAGIGDIQGVGAVDDLHDASTKKIAEEAQFLSGLLKTNGAESMLQAYDQRASTYGGKPEEISAIRDKLLKDPEGTLAALAGAPKYQYQRAADGSIISVNSITNEAETVYEGTPRAPSGYQYGEDGALTYIPGGPADPDVVGRQAGVRRDAVVSRPAPRRASAGASAPASAAYDPNAIKWD